MEHATMGWSEMRRSSLPVFVISVIVAGAGCRSSGPRNDATRDAAITKTSPSAIRSATPVGVASAEPLSPDAAAPAPSSESLGSKPEIWPTRFTESGRGFVARGDGVLEGSAKSIVCDDREPCRVLAEQPAGRDEQRRALTVMTVSLAETSREQFDPARITEGCEPLEYWLVRRDERGVVEVELLLEVCNDGYGAAGLGEDIVEVGDNRFSHEQLGGSNWRWSHRQVIQLSPRRLLEQANLTFLSARLGRSGRSWDWLKFSGNGEHQLPVCDARGEPNETAEHVSWLPIPVVEVDRDFATTGWTRASLGACSARAGGGEETGFVVHGKQSGPDDASLSVVGLTDGSFIVEIRDDHFVLAAKRPAFEDHLEVWTGRAGSRSIEPLCEPEPREKPEQWGVRVADGAVWSGSGAPSVERLKVELGSREGSVRLRLRLLDSAPFVTFVYSDSDDGASQKALIATSSLKFGRTRTLGETVSIDPKSATCRVRDGRLEPQLH